MPPAARLKPIVDRLLDYYTVVNLEYMKQLIVIAIVIASCLAVNTARAQVQIDLNLERSYPGYTYYNYPAWHGHMNDRVYYSHYHRSFERNHRDYMRGGQFDRDRFEKDRSAGRYHERH